VVRERATEKMISATVFNSSELCFQLRQVLLELGRPKPWQDLLAAETEWLIRQARGRARKDWILNTGCILLEHGEKLFHEAREGLSAIGESGYLTFRQLTKNSPVTGNRRDFRRWLTAEPWTERTKGKHYRIRLCDDFYWWCAKQCAGELARNLMEKKKLEQTPDGVQVDGGKVVGFEVRALEALEHLVRLHTKTVGRPLEEIDRDPKRHKVWRVRLTKPLPRWVRAHLRGRSLMSEADALMLANLIQQLRQESFQRGKSGHISKAALARALSISKRTFLRRGYGKIYGRIYKKPSHEEFKTHKEAQEKGFTEDELRVAKNSFQLRKEEVLIECAKCGRKLRIAQPCSNCHIEDDKRTE